MLEVGSAAPSFDLEDQDGIRHSLRAYAGRWVVLYFYPKDDTPGCTKEACSFRDSMESLSGLGAVVLGASADDAARHRRFAEKYGLNFPLLVDPDLTLLRAYGAWGEKQSFGRRHIGVLRKTFLIAPDGTIARVWESVKPDGHAEEVRNALRELQA